MHPSVWVLLMWVLLIWPMVFWGEAHTAFLSPKESYQESYSDEAMPACMSDEAYWTAMRLVAFWHKLPQWERGFRHRTLY